ncbi:unnamed protein product [Penicillium glandicola]
MLFYKFGLLSDLLFGFILTGLIVPVPIHVRENDKPVIAELLRLIRQTGSTTAALIATLVFLAFWWSRLEIQSWRDVSALSAGTGDAVDMAPGSDSTG